MKEAETIGYPVIIKAALGGGGKGMRVADTPEDFEESFRTAQKETQMAFGDSTMYVEHFVRHPRHIEFQIMADNLEMSFISVSVTVLFSEIIRR